MASGQEVNKSEVFKRPATKPAEWDSLRAGQPEKVLSAPAKNSPLILVPGFNIDAFDRIQSSSAAPMFVPFPEEASEDEVRMNRVTFDTVRDEGLYSIEGLLRRYDKVRSNGDNSALLITFKQGSKEVKARWQQIAEADKERYHWRLLKRRQPDGSIKDEVWGLIALHIITRDLPNWFWADFTHVDTEKELSWCATPKDPDGVTCPRDSTTRGPKAPSGKDGIRTETLGTKWANYILKGTQANFVTSTGAATVLSNPKIEEGFQKSSCITCHANATVHPSNSGPPNLGSTLNIGVPKSDFAGGGTPFLQSDFLWSIPFRAGSEQADSEFSALAMVPGNAQIMMSRAQQQK